MGRSSLAAVILCIGLSGGSLYAYSGGQGTADDPYQIACPADLIVLGTASDDYDKHFVLTGDIDLSGHTFDRAMVAGDSGSSAGTFEGVPFDGVFIGNRHVIRNLHIVGDEFLGLFGYLTSRALVRDVRLEDVSIQGSDDYVGGMLGYNHHGSIANCCSTGAVTGGNYVGGLVGRSYTGSVSNCYSMAGITGSGRFIGGLVGSNYYASISNSYSTGVVSGDNHVGGLVGYNYGAVSNSYSTGAVSGTGTSVGGFVGSSTFGSGMVNCFWDRETSGQTYDARATGLTTAQMQDTETFLNAGWDFVDETGNGVAEVWQRGEAGGYPQLALFQGYEPVTLRGEGTAVEPFLISSPLELAVVRYRPEAHYRLDADLSLAGMAWTIAVVPSFSGEFDGNGHVIGDLNIQGAGYLGLFGYLSGRAIVMNLGLEDGSISGNDLDIGSLAGRSAGYTANCYSSNDVKGQSMIGGLIGTLYGGAIVNCYNRGKVSGNHYITGGLVGQLSHGEVRRCYNAGVVSSPIPSGLVGLNLGGRVTDCVWDVVASEADGSDGGAGLSTEEMMDAEALALNGFADDPNWVLDSGQDYPHLAWEGTAGQTIPPVIVDWIGGAGTPEEPFEIDSITQLIKIGRTSLLWDRDFVLLNDLDFDPNLPGNRILEQGVIPSFSGRFDGNKHTVRNLHIVGVQHLGFFGTLDNGAEVVDLFLEGVSIDGAWDYVGGLAGKADGADLTGCSCVGILSGGDYVGGLVGYMSNSSVVGSQSDSVVSGSSEVGGLAGATAETEFRQCWSTGLTSGYWYVGGLVGVLSRSEAHNCYSTVDVNDAYENVGGLIGYADESTLRHCYSVGAVNGRPIYIGGLVGQRHLGTVEGCFWDVDTSGQSESGAGYGLTTNAMCDRQTYLDAGWDFTEETANGVDDFWLTTPTEGYPLLASQGEVTTYFVSEDFETGDLSHLAWRSGIDDCAWQVTSSAAHSGTYSVRAGAIGDSEGTTLEVKLDCIVGNVSFFVKVSCETGYDKLFFRHRRGGGEHLDGRAGLDRSVVSGSLRPARVPVGVCQRRVQRRRRRYGVAR